jgi:hypothetical protein
MEIRPTRIRAINGSFLETHPRLPDAGNAVSSPRGRPGDGHRSRQFTAPDATR